MAAKKKATKGKRYSDEEKQEILAYSESEGRGGQSKAAKKYGVSPLTLSNWRKAAGGTGAPAKGKASGKGKANAEAIDRDTVLRALSAKGFEIVRMQNVLTGEVMKEKIDPRIEKLGLDYGGLKGKASDTAVYVTQTTGQILVTMTLEKLISCTISK